MIQNENMSAPTQGSASKFKVPEREAGLNCKVNFIHHMADHLRDTGATSKVEPDTLDLSLIRHWWLLKCQCGYSGK